MPVKALPPGIDGVLGIPSLRLLPISIDPQRGRIALGAAALSAGNLPAGKPPQRLPLRWHRGVPLLQLTTSSGPVSALADTGAEGFFISSALASRLQPRGSAYPLRLVGFCGQQRVRSQSMAGVALGAGQPLPGAGAKSLNAAITAIITENPIFKQLGVEAIVGQEWLRHRSQRWRLDRQPPLLELW
jgi:hypothetical protein